MSDMQNPAGQGGVCGLRDPVKIKPHPTTISPAISKAINFSQDDGPLAAALRIALARKAVS